MKRILDITVEEFMAHCHEKGLKCTAQRTAVFTAIRAAKDHPSVDEIWLAVKASLPMVTRESVYRILNEFAAIGLLDRLDTLQSARYDTCTSPHAHFICEHCGNVWDYELDAAVTPPKDVRGRILHYELRMRGICEECLKELT